MKILSVILTLGFASCVYIPCLHAETQIATLRQGIPLDQVNHNPAELGNASNSSGKRLRAYPMQPPTIPHKIDNYQVDLRANKCLSCHARTRIEESQATMISVTHYMDRDGNFLASVSPNRYFCTQCHVTQVDKDALVENNFIDVEQLIDNKNKKKNNKDIR